jgi:NADPH-dependent ferric siderophore reductase
LGSPKRRARGRSSPRSRSLRESDGGGDLYAWVACESSVAKLVRSHLVDERQFDPKRIKAAGYWKRGAVAVHEMHEG